MRAYEQAYDFGIWFSPFLRRRIITVVKKPALTAALESYLKLKGHGRSVLNEALARRSVHYAISALAEGAFPTKPINRQIDNDWMISRQSIIFRMIAILLEERRCGVSMP